MVMLNNVYNELTHGGGLFRKPNPLFNRITKKTRKNLGTPA